MRYRPGSASAITQATRRPTPGDWPRFPAYVVARRHAVSDAAPGESVQVARPTVPKILLPLKITVKGAPAARPSGQTLDSDLARQTHWHLSGWTGQSRTSGGRSRLPGACWPDDVLLRFGGNGGHVCSVGGVPKEGQSRIRLCSCGQFYAYNGRRWKPMNQLHLWLHREYLCCDVSWLFDQGGRREWHFQPFPYWRRLLLRLEGWDA
jgi:hypothetical protein